MSGNPYRTAAPPEPAVLRCCGRCCPCLGGCTYGIKWITRGGAVRLAGIEYDGLNTSTTPPATFRDGKWVRDHESDE